jgi:hypothetical protein
VQIEHNISVASVLIGAGVVALLAYFMSDHWASTYDKWFSPLNWTDEVDMGGHTSDELYEFATKHWAQCGSKQQRPPSNEAAEPEPPASERQ